MKQRKFKFYFKRGPIIVWAFTEENAKILAQAEAIKQGWDPTFISKSEFNEMNKRQYLSWLEELKTLPVPGTRIYLPEDKINGRMIYKYEIGPDGIVAVVASVCLGLTMELSLKQIRQCIWDKTQ